MYKFIATIFVYLICVSIASAVENMDRNSGSNSKHNCLLILNEGDLPRPDNSNDVVISYLMKFYSDANDCLNGTDYDGAIRNATDFIEMGININKLNELLRNSVKIIVISHCALKEIEIAQRKIDEYKTKILFDADIRNLEKILQRGRGYASPSFSPVDDSLMPNKLKIGNQSIYIIRLP